MKNIAFVFKVVKLYVNYRLNEKMLIILQVLI